MELSLRHGPVGLILHPVYFVQLGCLSPMTIQMFISQELWDENKCLHLYGTSGKDSVHPDV